MPALSKTPPPWSDYGGDDEPGSCHSFSKLSNRRRRGKSVSILLYQSTKIALSTGISPGKLLDDTRQHYTGQSHARSSQSGNIQTSFSFQGSMTKIERLFLESKQNRTGLSPHIWITSCEPRSRSETEDDYESETWETSPETEMFKHQVPFGRPSSRSTIHAAPSMLSLPYAMGVRSIFQVLVIIPGHHSTQLISASEVEGDGCYISKDLLYPYCANARSEEEWIAWRKVDDTGFTYTSCTLLEDSWIKGNTNFVLGIGRKHEWLTHDKVFKGMLQFDNTTPSLLSHGRPGQARQTPISGRGCEDTMSGQGCASGRSLADTKVTSSYLSPGSIQQNAEDSHGIVTDDGCSWISTSNESASTVGTSIEKRREDMIWRIIQAVTRWLRLQFEQAHIKAGEYTAESCTNSSAQSNDTAQFQQDQVKRAGKRKSDARDSDKYDDSEDDNMLRPPPLGPDDRKDKEQEVIRLACPYFKYNPTKYQQWPICPGPGWSDVHRVKEHLYRKHRQPRFRCVRCWECFDSEQTYIDHQRAQIPCELGEKEPIEGFDAEQERQLKSRKKRSRVVSEIDKWKAVYQILFPHIPPERIPSPFYGDEAHTHETLTECEEYILREIPLRLREILVPEFERDLQIVEQSLQRRTIELTRATLASLFQEFRNMHLQSSVSTMTPSSSEAQDQAGPSSSHAQSPWFEPGENRSFLDFSMFDFDPIPPDGSLSLFDDVQLEDIPQAPTGSGNSAFKQSDSGYDSNNIERFDNEGRY